MKQPEDFAAALGLDDAAVQSRLAAIGLDPASRAQLREVADAAESMAGPLLDELYRRMRQQPELGALLASDAQVQALKGQQRRYLRELFTADIDRPYVLRRLWIGVVHHRVRLSPPWYLATYAHFICAHLDPIVSSAPTPDAAYAQLLALVRTVFFDASLALDAYGRVEDAAVWGTSQLTTPAPSAHVSGADGSAAGVPGLGQSYARIRLTAENTQDKRRFIGLTGEDLETLSRLRPIVERHMPAILEDFYTFLRGIPETAALVSVETGVRLKQQVASYWLELVEGAFDRPYAASRMRVGVMHEKIGLTPAWYLAGLARQLTGLLRAVTIEADNPVEATRALVRAVFFDVSFIIDAYMEARADSLLRTEGYANQLVAGLASAVAVVDAHDRLVSANRTMVDMCGGDAAVLYLLPAARVLPLPEMSGLIESMRADGTPHRVSAGRLGPRTYRITAMTLASGAAGDGAIAVVLDDVTDLLRLGDDLDAQVDRFEQLADTVGAVLWEIDRATWTVTAVNRAAVDLTGYRDVFFLGRPHAWDSCIVDADRGRFTTQAAALGEGQQAEIDYRLRRADGREVWLRSRLAAAAGDRLIGASIDVTAARRAEALRLEATAAIAGGVAHVVNNSLAAVLGNIELHAIGEGGFERTPLLRHAVAAADKATAMSARLMAFAQRHPLKAMLVSVNQVCVEETEALRALAGAAITVQLDLADELWDCRTDVDMLRMSLASLVTNARTAITGSGEITVRTRNLAGGGLAPEHEGVGADWVELEVCDSGRGMSREVKARAFEPFFTTRSLAEASGLGLSLVHGFVSQSGGHVELVSTEGRGTSVRLRFPRATGGSPVTASPTGQVALVVEDEESVRQVTVGMLRHMGYEVVATGSANEALQLAEARRPALVIADIVLGQSLDGVTLVQRLLAADPSLAVVLISGYPQSHFDLTELPPGVQFVPKPFSAAGLGRAVTNARGVRH